ncbi:MAG TPA: hypothetical protein PKM88_08645 [bacterium]|nr:hypothetical protein [bacterium]
MKIIGLFAVLLALAVPAAAAPEAQAPDNSQEMNIEIVTVYGTDSSTQPLAAFDDVVLPDDAAKLLRAPDRDLLRLAPGRLTPVRLLRFPEAPEYDNPETLSGKLVMPVFPERNTLRNILIMMFMGRN